MSGAGRSCLFSPREKIEMRGPPTTTKAQSTPTTLPPAGPFRPLPLWGPLRNSVEGKNTARWPWEREAARGLPPSPAGRGLGCGRGRAGEGGGRATLLKPAPRVTQKSPPGEDWRQSPLRSTEGHGAGSYSLSRRERVGVRAGGGGGRATLLKPTTLTPTGPFRPLPIWEPLQNRLGSWRGERRGAFTQTSPPLGETERGRGEAWAARPC